MKLTHQIPDGPVSLSVCVEELVAGFHSIVRAAWCTVEGEILRPNDLQPLAPEVFNEAFELKEEHILVSEEPDKCSGRSTG